MAKTAKPKPKQLNAKQARELGNAYDAAIEAGRKAYAKAGDLLDQLVAGGLVGVEFELGDGRTFTLVDEFAGGKTKAFKPTYISRYAAKISAAPAT